MENTNRIKYYNIPVFMPERACPFQCIFCDQQKITSQISTPNSQDILQNIDAHLRTIPNDNSKILIAFFGGTFTGIPMEEQAEYLKLVQPYINSGRVVGIRISTRPDYINQQNLDLLKTYNVTHIELGVQSLVDEVLELSQRGHTYADVKNASKLITENGFVLGLQMMLGLPGDNWEYSLLTASRIIELKAVETRIYPSLVIKGTALEKIMIKGDYTPMTTEDAVSQASIIFQLFQKNNVKVLRMGLYASDDLEEDIVAGPNMRHFKEKVMTYIWKQILEQQIDKSKKANCIDIYIAPNQLNFAVGYLATNRKLLLEVFPQVKFKTDAELTDYMCYVDYC